MFNINFVKKLSLIISFSMIFLLAACGDSGPSDSTIEAQLQNRMGCAELSVTNYQKINGYVQNDGSYLEQINYDITYTPSDQMLRYVNDYDVKMKSIEADGAADEVKLQSVKDQINALGCTASYLSAAASVQSIRSKLTSVFGYTQPLSSGSNVNPAVDESLINTDISSLDSKIIYFQNQLTADQSSESRWPQQRSRDDIGNIVYMSQDQAVETDQSNLNALQLELNVLQNAKTTLDDAISQLSTCQENAQQILTKNQSVIDHLNALNTEMAQVQSADLTALQTAMNNDCEIIGHGNLQMFDTNNVDAYGQTTSLAQNGYAYHFVNSDNGWVITR